jgi:hypothetical protein
VAKKSKTMTLKELATAFITHLEESGKSAGTCFSYLMEMKLAQSHFGEETLLSALTSDAVAAFNTSDRVMKLKSGLNKSQLSIDKTRRVLRMALTWAHQTGLVEDALVDPKRDTLVQREEPASEPKKAKRSRKLEVAQDVAVEAANEAEAQLGA